MFDRDLADIRFGYGRAPHIAAPSDIEDMISGLTGPDLVAARYPIESFAAFRERMSTLQSQNRIRRRDEGTDRGRANSDARAKLIRDTRRDALGWLGQSVLRAAMTPTPFRERLVGFWADHFTAHGRNAISRHGGAPYIDDAIRPAISGRFSALLRAAVMHPVMLEYLDQSRSLGPLSRRGKETGRGLNENLAREVLELHTLGVGGPYTQKDVRELAELLTGLSATARDGMVYRKGWAEPGAETVLDRTYSADADLTTVHAVLDDLAVHPATAMHIARKIATHFVSDAPPEELIKALTDAFLETGGDLRAVYLALLSHPAAWSPMLSNVKPPFDFVASSIRALAPDPNRLELFDYRDLARGLARPLARMGQAWLAPPGPDGWPEMDAHWLAPQGVAARIRWAMDVPQFLLLDLPDPERFAGASLGRFLTEPVRFAARAAESRAEALGLVLMSPAFQRR